MSKLVICKIGLSDLERALGHFCAVSRFYQPSEASDIRVFVC